MVDENTKKIIVIAAMKGLIVFAETIIRDVTKSEKGKVAKTTSSRKSIKNGTIVEVER